MNKLWQKNWQLDKFIETFETKDDLVCDQQLVKYDVYGSLAHAKMLAKIGILKNSEFEKLKKGLLEILAIDKKGQFNPQAGDEDIHTKIENYLTQKYGEHGKKIHTGRSRNDQVLTALRLLTKEKLFVIWDELLVLAESFVNFANKYQWLAMPGYSHMQIAMPSSVGMWAGAQAESLLDSIKLLKTVFDLNNQSPLGSAAGYGAPLALDREYAAKILGFAKVQANSLYCQNSRGKIEAMILAALISIGQDINKFAGDVMLFTTAEFNYFKVGDKLCSGSSIMPQKKNVDIAELLRSKVHLLLGYYVQIVGLAGNLASGYNRDLQDSKKPLLASLEISEDILGVANVLINNLTPQADKLRQGLKPEIFAAHHALKLVKKGLSFRKAYQEVGKNLSQLSAIDSQSILKSSRHIGGTSNLGLAKLAQSLAKEKQHFRSAQKFYQIVIRNLIN